MILDANERIGDSWRKRWDSLRVFTPARADGLAGWPFPGSPWSFPAKDEMGDYMEAYAKRFHLPVRTGVRVDGVSREEDWYVVASRDRRIGGNRSGGTDRYRRPRGRRPFRPSPTVRPTSSRSAQSTRGKRTEPLYAVPEASNSGPG